MLQSVRDQSLTALVPKTRFTLFRQTSDRTRPGPTFLRTTARDNTKLERRGRIATLARLSAPARGPGLRSRPGAEPALLRRSARLQARVRCPPRVRQTLGHGRAPGRRRRAVSDRAEPSIA